MAHQRFFYHIRSLPHQSSPLPYPQAAHAPPAAAPASPTLPSATHIPHRQSPSSMPTDASASAAAAMSSALGRPPYHDRSPGRPRSSARTTRPAPDTSNSRLPSPSSTSPIPHFGSLFGA